MNENIDLTQILKNCPKGWEFYSSNVGRIKFVRLDLENTDYPIIVRIEGRMDFGYTKEGWCWKDYPDGECTLFPSKEQRDWSKFTSPWYKKEESIKPKFKVGDRIRHKETNKDDVYEISKVYDDSYEIVGFNWGIYIKYQDQYELVPNKFDPHTLQKFDKVLIKHDNDITWHVAMFSHLITIYDDITNVSHLVSATIQPATKYCVPYNDETKHLVGTADEVPEFYRYWEK